MPSDMSQTIEVRSLKIAGAVWYAKIEVSSATQTARTVIAYQPSIEHTAERRTSYMAVTSRLSPVLRAVRSGSGTVTGDRGDDATWNGTGSRSGSGARGATGSMARGSPARARSFVFFSSRRRHTRFDCDWSSDVCSSD